MRQPVWVERFQSCGEDRYRVAFRFEAMVQGLEYRVSLPGKAGPREFIYLRNGKVVDVYGGASLAPLASGAVEA